MALLMFTWLLRSNAERIPILKKKNNNNVAESTLKFMNTFLPHYIVAY